MKRNESSYSFLLFTIKGQHFALELDNLVEVTEPVHVSSLPFVPDYIDGLINLNSQIIPQIHAADFLSDFIGSSQNIESQETLVVFRQQKSTYALRVGMIIDSVNLPADTLSFYPSAQSLNDSDYASDDENQPSQLVCGEFKHIIGNDTHTVKIFDCEAAEDVLGTQENQNTSDSQEDEQSFLGELSTQNFEQEQRQEFLLFTIQGQPFATPLNNILEVVDLENLQSIEHVDESLLPYIKGLSLVRGQPLLVLQLNRLLQLNEHNPLDKHSGSEASLPFTSQERRQQSVITLAHHEHYCAVAVDEITGMIEAGAEQIIFDNDSGKELIKLKHHTTAQTASEETETLVETLQTQALFELDVFKELQAIMPKLQDSYEAPIKTLDVLQFNLFGNLYGILIDDIQRVVNNQRIEPLLTPKACLAGSCEYEGHVIPVINLAKQLCPKQHNSYSANEQVEQYQESVVVQANRQFWALGIQASEKIVPVKEVNIDFLDEEQAHFIKAYANHENQLIHLLNTDAICDYNL